MRLPIDGNDNYFDHDADIGIIGHGETIEICFAHTAQVMFSLMADVSQIQARQIITFEFVEADLELALVTTSRGTTARRSPRYEGSQAGFNMFRYVNRDRRGCLSLLAR